MAAILAPTFDVAFIPTLCVIVASYYTAESVNKIKFYTNVAAAFLMWGLINFSICYANTLNTRVIGDATYATIDKLGLQGSQGFNMNVAYHGALAVLAISMVLQGGAHKMNLLTGVFFLTLWTIGVFVPLTHWQSAVQANTSIGWLSANGGGYGLLDHAGAHHINMAAGATSLVLTFLLGSQAEAVKANECFTTALWALFGMAGYLVAGDPNSKSGGAGPALVCVLMSVSTAILSAVVFEVLHNGGKNDGKGAPTSVTIITAIHYGLVAVTSGASLISPMWAAFFGFFTVLVCYTLNQLLAVLNLRGLGTNSIFSIHFLGAAVSSALTGLFANPTYGGAAAANAGSFYGSPIQLGRQCAGISVTLLVAVVGTIVAYAFTLLVSKALGNATLTLAEDAAAPAADKAVLTAAEPASAA